MPLLGNRHKLIPPGTAFPGLPSDMDMNTMMGQTQPSNRTTEAGAARQGDLGQQQEGEVRKSHFMGRNLSTCGNSHTVKISSDMLAYSFLHLTVNSEAKF